MVAGGNAMRVEDSGGGGGMEQPMREEHAIYRQPMDRNWGTKVLQVETDHRKTMIERDDYRRNHLCASLKENADFGVAYYQIWCCWRVAQLARNHDHSGIVRVCGSC